VRGNREAQAAAFGMDAVLLLRVAACFQAEFF